MGTVEKREELSTVLNNWNIVRALTDKSLIFAFEEVNENGEMVFYIYENEDRYKNALRTIMSITITNYRFLLSFRPLSFTTQLTNEEMKPLLMETVHPKVKWFYHHRNLQNAYFDNTDQLNNFLITLEKHF